MRIRVEQITRTTSLHADRDWPAAPAVGDVVDLSQSLGWIEDEVRESDVDAALAEYGVLDAEALLAAIDAARKAGG